MNAVTWAVVLAFAQAGPGPTTRPAGKEPDVKLWEWTKGIAVESRRQEGMAMYLWFYEWQLFGAIRQARDRHGKGAFSSSGSYENKRHISKDRSRAVITTPEMVLKLQAVDDGAEMQLTVTNHTDHDWPDIAAIVPCFNPGPPESQAEQYPEARTNPQFTNRKTYCLGPEGLVHMNGRVCHYSQKLRKAINAASPDGKGTFGFSSKWKPRQPDAAAGIMIRESADRRWVTGIAWEDFVAVQAHNPWQCMHLWVRVGPLKRRQSRTVRGKLYLFKGGKQDCLRSFRRGFSAAATRPCATRS